MSLLEKNVGGIDKVLRIGAGLVMFYLGFIDEVFITDELGSYLLGGFGFMFGCCKFKCERKYSPGPYCENV